MFGSDKNSKKELKNLENVLKIVYTAQRDKTKTSACLKLLEIFENSLDININFDNLLISIEDLIDCNINQCKKIWLNVR